MDFSLTREQQGRFRERIRAQRSSRRLGQENVIDKITLGGDLRGEISRFENGISATVERWLTEPYLSQVARAYGFESAEHLVQLFHEARTGSRPSTVEAWHPSFPGVERSEMELPRAFRFVRQHLDIYGSRPGGTASEALAEVPPNLDRIAVVVDSTSGVATVRRQLEQALLHAPAQRAPLSFEFVDSAALRRLPIPAILVDDWTVGRLLPVLDRLVSGGHLGESQAARARKMLGQVPAGGLAGLPISLVLDAVAAEARATGPVGHLHRRLVAAGWLRGAEEHPGWALGDGDRGVYTDFWAEIVVTSGSLEATAFDAAFAQRAATAALARRGWHSPDAAELASRALKVAHVRSVGERERLLGEVAAELRRPAAERLVDGLVGMGLLVRDEKGLRAATPAIAMLAAAWGLAERPELLRGRAALLCLPRTGELMAEIAAFGAKPEEVWSALEGAPDWAAVERDHAWIRFAAASPDVDGVGRTGITECWSRVLYERSGHGRWFERVWGGANEVRALDRALRAVSERLRAHLPVFGSMEEFITSLPESTRARIDALVPHPIIEDAAGSGRTLSALAQLAPWQFPALTVAAEEEVERHDSLRSGLGPPPDPREVAAWACLAGFEPGLQWLSGAEPSSLTFGRLPLPARLVAACRPECSDEARRRAREHALWPLSQPTTDVAALQAPIRLDREGLPLLHMLLGLDRAPRSVWDAAVETLRMTDGLPKPTREFVAADMRDDVRCALAEALADVDELVRIEGQVDRALAAGNLSTQAGEVVAFGVQMWSRDQRLRVAQRQPTEHPLTQLANGLSTADAPGHSAAVALFRLGRPEALRRRARGELAALPAGAERAWLDCWRLADLWDASLEQVRSHLPAADESLLLKAEPNENWGHLGRDRACMEAEALRRLGVDRPDLSALAEAYSRLRHCRAATSRRGLGSGLHLPLDERLAEFCDRLRGERPAGLDLLQVALSRAARAIHSLTVLGDVETLRAWNEVCREEDRSDVDPATPLLPAAPSTVRGVIRVGTDLELRRDTIRHAVAEVLKTSAPLRALAWREASEPRARYDLMHWAIEAGEPFPAWLRTAIHRRAARGEGGLLWLQQPAFRRERLAFIRAHGPGKAASLASHWFDDAQKEGEDDLVGQYAEIVLEWAEQAPWPFLPGRWATDGLDPLFRFLVQLGELQPGLGDADERRQGPPWRDLARFFERALADARVPRARVVAVLERLWSVFTTAPLAPDPRGPRGESGRGQLAHELLDVFDDLARLLLAAGAPGRIEALLQRGIPLSEGAETETFDGAIGAQFIGLLPGLPAGARLERTRAEILQVRVVERFQPPGFDPRWLLGQGPLLEAWAWRQLAARGDEDAVERLVGKLDGIDLAEPRWIEHEAVLSALIAHRRDLVVDWLLREAAKSEAHALEARGLVVAWAHAWGPRTAEMAAWARGGPEVGNVASSGLVNPRG